MLTPATDLLKSNSFGLSRAEGQRNPGLATILLMSDWILIVTPALHLIYLPRQTWWKATVLLLELHQASSPQPTCQLAANPGNGKPSVRPLGNGRPWRVTCHLTALSRRPGSSKDVALQLTTHNTHTPQILPSLCSAALIRPSLRLLLQPPSL